MPSLVVLVFAASACLHFAAASPVYMNSEINIRATYNCTDLRADPSTLCWTELGLSDYIADWNRTTPTCKATGNDDGANCCTSDEPWTTCFLRLAYGTAGTDCSTINIQACHLAQLSPNLKSSIAPKAAYVVRNIVEINNIFTSYYTALQARSTSIGGSDSESANLHQILRNVATLNTSNLIKALLAGLPFLGTSTILADGSQQIKPNVNTVAAQAFVQSLQNTRGVSSLLFNTSLDNSQEIAIGNDLAAILSEVGDQLQSALGLIMSDVQTFTAWAENGLYSGPTGSLIVSQAAVGITSAFDTYLVGEALSQSQFSATPASTTLSKAAFQQSRTCTTLGDICKDNKGRVYYWSQAYQTQYQINEPKNWASGTGLQQLGFETSAYGLLEYIETTDTYMPVLFDGAYNCTLEGKAGGSAVNFYFDGSLDVACLSALPIYLSKGSSCPAGAIQVGGKCPFGFNGDEIDGGRGLDSSQGVSRLPIYPPRGAHIRIREGLRAPLAGMLHHFQ